ncbi:MAG: TrmH family RNA methyltransferase [Candidatus Sedimenticola sp. (ex Thyasira tokunagai)]
MRKTKRRSRNEALQRYEKHRRRNLLSTPGVHDFIIVLDHLKAGFNVPKIFRSAEAFGAHEIHLIDIGPFDPSPAKGAFKTVPARPFDTFEKSYADLKERGYTLFTLEADLGELLTSAEFPKKSAFIFGHEEMGISFDPSLYPEIRRLSIPQYGRIESLNVSIAASVVMYEYVRKRRYGTPVNRPAPVTRDGDPQDKIRRNRRKSLSNKNELDI